MKPEVSAGGETTNCKQSEGAEMSVRTAEATEGQMTSRMGLGTIMWVHDVGRGRTPPLVNTVNNSEDKD